MARTESLAIQVHPNNEQSQIQLMEKFHWSLLSSQEIKTIDNHLERRGDDIYQVRSSECYVKLTFKRELDTPNLAEIRALESQYYNLELPNMPTKPDLALSWLLFAPCFLPIVIVWAIRYFFIYSPEMAKYSQLLAAARAEQRDVLSQRSSILAELEKYG